MNYDREILGVLDGIGGYPTGRIAGMVVPIFGHNRRTHSAFIRQRLIQLEAAGKVRKMDDQKPVCWVKVEA